MVYDPTFDFLWKNRVAQAFFSVLRYSQLIILLETSNFTIQVIIFSLLVLLLVLIQVHFVCFGFIWPPKARQTSTGLKNTERFLVGIQIGLNSILFIPIVQVFLKMVICIQGSRFSDSREVCYDGVGITTALFGALGFLLIAKEVFFLCYLMNDQDPFGKNPFSHPKPTVLLVRYLSKLILTVYAYIDSFVSSA